MELHRMIWYADRYGMVVIRFEWVRDERSFDYTIRGLFECTGKIHQGKKYLACYAATRYDDIAKRVWHSFLIDQVNSLWGYHGRATKNL